MISLKELRDKLESLQLKTYQYLTVADTRLVATFYDWCPYRVETSQFRGKMYSFFTAVSPLDDLVSSLVDLGIDVKLAKSGAAFTVGNYYTDGHDLKEIIGHHTESKGIILQK